MITGQEAAALSAAAAAATKPHEAQLPVMSLSLDVAQQATQLPLTALTGVPGVNHQAHLSPALQRALGLATTSVGQSLVPTVDLKSAVAQPSMISLSSLGPNLQAQVLTQQTQDQALIQQLQAQGLNVQDSTSQVHALAQQLHAAQAQAKAQAQGINLAQAQALQQLQAQAMLPKIVLGQDPGGLLAGHTTQEGLHATTQAAAHGGAKGVNTPNNLQLTLQAILPGGQARLGLADSTTHTSQIEQQVQALLANRSGAPLTPALATDPSVGQKRKAGTPLPPGAKHQRQDLWERRYQDLLEYKNMYGHCNVPQNISDKPQLGYWVCKQRTEYQRGTLNPERKRRLEEVGFQWNRWDEMWAGRLKDLAEYKAKYGHCNVPAKWKEYPQLGTWVNSQRTSKSRGKLSKEREDKLNELGFEWDVVNTNWEKNYQSLVAFKNAMGHCNVPMKWPANENLSKWVSNQRSKMARGKLTAERVKLLQQIGLE